LNIILEFTKFNVFLPIYFTIQYMLSKLLFACSVSDFVVMSDYPILSLLPV